MNNRNVGHTQDSKDKEYFFFLDSKHCYASDISTWSKILNIQDGSRGDKKLTSETKT